MAGARLVEDIIGRGGRDRYQITVFGEEPHGNYNRILRSSVLAGSHDQKDIFINPLSWYSANDVTLHAGVRVETIDAGSRHVTGTGRVIEPYDKLVIATGSKPLVPRMGGSFLGTGGI